MRRKGYTRINYGRYGRHKNRKFSFSALAVYIFLIIALVAVDQAVKIYLVSLNRNFDVTVLGNFLHFCYVENSGAAFGILQNKQIVLIGVTSVMILVCLFFILLRYFREKLINVSLALIVAGGMGNLIDRVFRHYVVDFIYIKIIDFPVFNIADSCVCIGTVLLCLYFIKNEAGDSRKRKMFRKYGR